MDEFIFVDDSTDQLPTAAATDFALPLVVTAATGTIPTLTTVTV
jgi:hypothetical protein